MNNIFDDLPEDVLHPDEAAEAVLDEQAEISPDVDSQLDEALLRIEQAMLYKTLITHNMFESGSARPEVLQRVNRELREYAKKRLNVLIGVQPEDSPQVAQESQFTAEEAEFVRSLYRRAQDRGKAPTVHTPRLNHVASTEPQFTSPVIQTPRPMAPVRSVSAAHQAPSAKTSAVSAKRGRRKSQNISETTGRDLSQAGNPKALPMPTTQQMNAMAVASATSSAASMGGSPGDIKGQVLASVIKGLVKTQVGDGEGV